MSLCISLSHNQWRGGAFVLKLVAHKKPTINTWLSVTTHKEDKREDKMILWSCWAIFVSIDVREKYFGNTLENTCCLLHKAEASGMPSPNTSSLKVNEFPAGSHGRSLFLPITQSLHSTLSHEKGRNGWKQFPRWVCECQNAITTVLGSVRLMS